MGRTRNRGLSLLEALVASSVFLLISTTCVYNFKNVITQSSHRLLFQAASKQVDVTVVKLVDALQSSQASGVGVKQLGTSSSALSVQRALKTSSMGTVAWEEALHLYWRNPGENVLRYTKIKKEDAQKAGLLLSNKYPLRPTPEQIDVLVESFSKKSKVLVPNLETFDVSEDWMTDEKPVDIIIKTMNPRMQEQRYGVQRAVWIGR